MVEWVDSSSVESAARTGGAAEDRLRILFSFPGIIGAAGVGWTAWNQVNELVRAGHEVHLVAAKQAKPIPGLGSLTLSLTIAGVKIPHRVLGRVGSFKWHDRVAARALQRVRPDIVHAWPGSVLGTVAAARTQGIPLVRECPNTHTEHAYSVVAREYARLGLTPPRGASHTRNETLLALEEQEWQAATALLAPSEVVAESFRARGIPDSRLLRHQYGCTVDRPVERNDDDRQFTAVFLGAGGPRKGLHHALRAWQESTAKENGRFLVHGSLESDYRNHLGDLLRLPGVEVAGFTSDPLGALLDSDVLLLPSIEEGSALVTYEAQVMGCVPLVSTAAGALLTDGVEGLVHDVADVGTLAAQLNRLSSDRGELARLRQNALDHSADLTWEVAGQRLVSAYKLAMEGIVKSSGSLQPSDISIVLCTRDRADMLRNALDAMRLHTHPEIEVIVVDSGSRDASTREVVGLTNYRYIRSDVPGLSIARNIGLHASTRPIVVYTDDDCVITPGWHSVLLRHFADSEIAAVTGAMRHPDEPPREASLQSFTRAEQGLDAGHGAIMAFRREILLRLGGFDEVLGAGRRLAGAEDLDMFCRVLGGDGMIVKDLRFGVVHMNTRSDDDFERLLLGYGLGVGALGNKWLRTRLAAGVLLNVRILRRSLVGLMRVWNDERERRGAVGYLKGYLLGFCGGSRMTLRDQRFVDDDPPAAVRTLGEVT